MKSRSFPAVFFFLMAMMVSSAAETNYFCVVCGKGPLTNHVWMTKWGALCDECYKLENHCSICGLPVRDGDGHIQTGDGRFICKFDKTNAVMDAATAKDIFADTRHDLVVQFGQGFTLNFPEVTVNIFDVDYWSEKGRSDGLHKFGFSQTRKSAGGQCTHEVVLLSGQLREDITATAAHEYTHLWINENLPPGREIDKDTVEGICELSAYKLMESRSQREQEQRILDNPYTHGEIQKLIAIEAAKGMGCILNWVKDGVTPTLDDAAAAFAPMKTPAAVSTNIPPPLPAKLKFAGFLVIGRDVRAVINGVAFSPGDSKRIKLRDKTVLVRCLQVGSTNVVIETDQSSRPTTLKIGEER